MEIAVWLVGTFLIIAIFGLLVRYKVGWLAEPNQNVDVRGFVVIFAFLWPLVAIASPAIVVMILAVVIYVACSGDSVEDLFP